MLKSFFFCLPSLCAKNKSRANAHKFKLKKSFFMEKAIFVSIVNKLHFIE